MATWDTGPFDNDDASDWLYELEESSDTSVVAAAFDAVVNIGDSYLEAPECAHALAAAAIIAALGGRPVERIPDNAKDWIENHRDLNVSALVLTARSAIERIRMKSELQELWDETEHAGKWRSSLDSLSSKLAAMENGV